MWPGRTPARGLGRRGPAVRDADVRSPAGSSASQHQFVVGPVENQCVRTEAPRVPPRRRSARLGYESANAMPIRPSAGTPDPERCMRSMVCDTRAAAIYPFSTRPDENKPWQTDAPSRWRAQRPWRKTVHERRRPGRPPEERRHAVRRNSRKRRSASAKHGPRGPPQDLRSSSAKLPVKPSQTIKSATPP